MNLDANELKLEKDYLENTLETIDKQISSLGQELYEKEEKIKEFQKFIWDSKADMDDQEMKSMMGASDLEITLALNKSKHFKRNIKMLEYSLYIINYNIWIYSLKYRYILIYSFLKYLI